MRSVPALRRAPLLELLRACSQIGSSAERNRLTNCRSGAARCCLVARLPRRAPTLLGDRTSPSSNSTRGGRGSSAWEGDRPDPLSRTPVPSALLTSQQHETVRP